MTDRRTQILNLLGQSRRFLRDGLLYTACACLSEARTLMAEAPASTRRRWKVQAEVNARKRAARASHRYATGGF